MINALPIFGWLLDLVFKTSLAIPFYIVWVVFGIGERYFAFLPNKYLSPGFWDCVGVFIVVPILYGIFVPKLFHVSQQVNKE